MSFKPAIPIRFDAKPERANSLYLLSSDSTEPAYMDLLIPAYKTSPSLTYNLQQQQTATFTDKFLAV